MKLYGVHLSPFTERIILQIEAKGIADDIKHVSMTPDDIKAGQNRRLNPLGRIPVLEHDGEVIGESGVIAEYIEERFPDRPMLPEDAMARARARYIARATDIYVLAGLFPLFTQLRVEEKDENLIRQSVEMVEEGLDAIEWKMEAAPYAAGEAMTLADFALMPAMYFLEKYLPVFGAEPLAGRPKTGAWWAAVKTTDLYQASARRVDKELQALLERMKKEQEGA